MSDSSTSVSELREVVRQFVDEREWARFHTPKNISMALAIEAAELMEHFQWLTAQQSREVAGDRERKGLVGEELADVLCYCLAMANELDLDVSEVLADKMVKNRLKYPVDQFRGRYGPDDPTAVEPE